MLQTSRRNLMLGAAAAAFMTGAVRAAGAAGAARARPLPLSAVRLRPSDFATAVEVNRAYLHRLEPDRLLHNFRKYAGLEPKAAIYGGWESDTIAGHTLGHYLTALTLTWQQTGDPEMRRRADSLDDELAADMPRRQLGIGGANLLQRERVSVSDLDLDGVVRHQLCHLLEVTASTTVS